MNRPAEKRKDAPPSVLLRVFRTTLLIFLILFVVMLLGTGLEQLIFLVIGHGAFGWLGFLIRVIPAIQWNPMAIATALVCVVFLLIGAHRFLTWLARAWQTDQADAAPWRTKWTVSLMSLVLLAFVAGTAVVGAMHQIVWLGTSTEPWIRSERTFATTLVYRFADEISNLRKASKPLPAEVYRRMCSEAAVTELRVVVLSDREGLPWLVAVGAYEPTNPGWKRCSFMGWTGKGEEESTVQGTFTGDRWAALITEAESGRSLERFGR